MSLTFNPTYNYVRSGDGLTTKECFMRFTNVTIPAGSQIIKAYLAGVTKTQSENISTYGRIVVYFVDEDNASSPTTEAQFIALSLTSGQELPSFFGNAYSVGKSQDITTELQKIIDRPGWVSGNSVVMVIKNGSVSGTNLDVVSKDNTIISSPNLVYFYKLCMSSDGSKLVLGLYAQGIFYNPSVYESRDGGHTWSSLKVPYATRHQSLTFIYMPFCCDADASLIGIYLDKDSWGDLYYLSLDGGETWVKKSAHVFFNSNSDGSYLFDGQSVSIDNGNTWVVKAPIGHSSYGTGCINQAGNFMCTAGWTGNVNITILVSSDYGQNWSSYGQSFKPSGQMSCSSDGKYIALCNGYYSSIYGVYVSSNYGASFTKVLSSSSVIPYKMQVDVRVSSTGQYMACFEMGTVTSVLTSTDYGQNWVSRQIDPPSTTVYITSLVMSSDGKKIVVSAGANWVDPALNVVYISEDYGVTWVKIGDIIPNSRLEPTLVVDYVSKWSNLTDSRYWQPSDAGSVWDGVNSQWNFNVLTSSDGGSINVRGDWHVGFRPSKLRLIHDRSATNFNIFIYAQDGMLASSLNYVSNSDIDLNFTNRGDISYIEIQLPAGENTAFHISALEFYMGDAFSNTVTSTSTTSTTTSTVTIDPSITNSTSTSTTSSSTTTSSSSTSSSSSTCTSSTTLSSSSTQSTYTTGSTTTTSNTQSTTTSTTRSTVSTNSTSSSTSSSSSTASTASTNSSTSSSSSTASTLSTVSTQSTISTTSSSTSTSSSSSSSSSSTSTCSTVTTATTAPPVIESVAASADDGYAYYYLGAWEFDKTGSDLYLGLAAYVCRSFLRFTTVPIPAGATITGAYLQLKAYSSVSTTTCKVKVHFEAADNPTAPTTGSDLAGRSLGTGVSWTIPAWTADTWYDSPEIKTALQEVIDRGGWANNNALQVHIVDDSSSAGAYRQGSSWNRGDHSHVAKLVVTYTT